jgi:hypothetical protein
MSGSERRASLPDDLRTLKLAEIATFRSGKFLPKEARVEDGRYPVYGANGVIGRTNEALVSSPVITVGRVGAIGEVHLIDEPAWVSDNALIVEPQGDLPIAYLAALLETIDYASIRTGTSQPLITQTSLAAQEVSLPSLVQQKRAVDLLQAVDRTILARRDYLDSLECLVAASIDDMTRRLEGATTSRLGDVARVERGYTWKKADERATQDGDALPVVRIGNVQPGGIDMRDRLWIHNVPAEKAALKAVGPNTILIVGSNGNPKRVGNAYLATPAIQGHLYASFLMGVTPELVPARFVWRYLQSSTIQRMITNATSGSTGLMNIGLGWMRDLPIPCPSREACEELITHIEAIDAARVEAASVLDEARRLRTALVRLLLSGGHEIPDSYDRFLAEENSDGVNLEPATV